MEENGVLNQVLFGQGRVEQVVVELVLLVKLQELQELQTLVVEAEGQVMVQEFPHLAEQAVQES